MAVDKKTLFPFQIYYQDHQFALEQGDPCLGTIEATTESEAISQVKAQGLGKGYAIVAAHIPDGGVSYRDVKTGCVSAKFPTGFPSDGTVWYPFGYFDEPGLGKPDPKIKCLALDLRIARMEKIIKDQYPDWRPYQLKLRGAQDMLAETMMELAQKEGGQHA